MSRKLFFLTIAGLLAWCVLALWIVPSLIRAGYDERSLGIINGVFDGRSDHQVDFYLGAWWTLARLATGLIIATIVVGWTLLRFSTQKRTAFAKILSGDPTLEHVRLFWFAVALGTLAGLAEAGYALGLDVITRRPAAQFHIGLLWMTPLAAALTAVLLASILLVLARIGETKIGVRQATMIFGFMVVYAIAQSEKVSLHPVAEVVLSLGIVALITRAAAANPGKVDRFARAAPGGVGAVAIVLGLLAVVSTPSVREWQSRLGRAEADDERPNVVLIVLDTARAANLSLYGYERATTPWLDDWARSGVVFDRAYSTTSWTLPAHVSMFTGRHLFESPSGFFAPFGDADPTLAEVLASQGYATGGFVANLLYTSRASGLARGFDRYEDFRISLSAVARSAWLPRLAADKIPGVGRVFPHERKIGGYVTEDFIDWVDEQEGPFFAFLNYFDAHAPYVSPEPFPDTFGRRATRRWPYTTGWRDTPESDYSIEYLQPWLNMYDGALRYLDTQIEAVAQALADRGELENTIVVIVSDHGEMWGEQGEVDHAMSLYAPVLHVPLVISFPGRVPSETRVDRPVSVLDLPATILDLAGLSDVSPIPGNSLASTWSDRGVDREPVLAELEAADMEGTPFWAPISRGSMAAVFLGDFHYILNGDGVEQLFRLSDDPDELRDLAGNDDFRSDLVRLRGALEIVRP